MFDFTILTSDLTDLRDRFVAKGWLAQDEETGRYEPVDGIQLVRLSPKRGDTLHRIYVRVHSQKARDEEDIDESVTQRELDRGEVPTALRTKIGRFVRNNGTFDEARKAWKVGPFWIVNEKQAEPDHAFQ